MDRQIDVYGNRGVKEGSTISQAARAHGIPHSTLYDRISGRVSHGVNPGPKTYLSKHEEKDLSDFLVHTNSVNESSTPDTSNSQHNCSAATFSPEEEQLFQRRFEEKYDLPDPLYPQWLKTKPPKEHADMNTEHELLGLEHSMSITPCLIAKDQESSTSGNDLTSCPEPSHITSSVTQSITPPEHKGQLNYISKYLIQYVPTKKVNTGKRARVLTSDECAKIIF